MSAFRSLFENVQIILIFFCVILLFFIYTAILIIFSLIVFLWISCNFPCLTITTVELSHLHSGLVPLPQWSCPTAIVKLSHNLHHNWVPGQPLAISQWFCGTFYQELMSSYFVWSQFTVHLADKEQLLQQNVLAKICTADSLICSTAETGSRAIFFWFWLNWGFSDNLKAIPAPNIFWKH